jgi:hypothetical protein
VILSSNEPNTTIYYTTNGSTPTEASPTYSTPISISATSALKFFGKDAAGNSSAVQTVSFTIEVEAPPAGQYLRMDGVDDILTLPSMTFTEIVMDFKVNSKGSFERYWSLPLGAEFFQVASGAVNDSWTAGVTLYLDGVAQTNTTPVMALGVRGVARAVISTTKTNVIYVMHNNGGAIAHGDLYNIKVYNGTTLVAHYDMALGNVQDQTGNGRHATLTGGTWV